MLDYILLAINNSQHSHYTNVAAMLMNMQYMLTP